MNLLEQKKQLRQEILHRRSQLTERQRTEKSRQISHFLLEIDEFRQANTVFCFISYLDEVDTHGLINEFLERGLTLAVPKIVGKTEMHSVRLRDWSELTPDRLGILTPKSDEIVSGPFDLVVTPGVGFTAQGDRLGYGRGYYDRWFAQNQVKTRIGIAFESQLVETLPTEATDVPLHMLVTETGVIDFRD